MSWLSNLLTSNKANELKPTFGQKYLYAIGYNDKHDEIYYEGTTNLEIVTVETKAEMAVSVAEKFENCEDLRKALQISTFEMLKLMANEKSHFEDILKFLYQSINGLTLLCSIYIVTHEATIIHATKSKHRPISKFLLGHHVILTLPMETPVYDMEGVKRSISLMLTKQQAGGFAEYFLYEASAFIDYSLKVQKPAYEILNELLDQKLPVNLISLFMELPKFEEKRSYENYFGERSSLRFILNVKKVIYLCEQKFGFESTYNAGNKPISWAERDKLGDSISSYINELYIMDFNKFPPPLLRTLYDACKKYEKEYCFALYENDANLPQIQTSLENYVAHAYKTLKVMPFQKDDGCWVFEANDVNSFEIRKKYLSKKICIVFTEKTKHLIEPLMTPSLLYLSSKEKQMKDYNEPILLYDGTEEYCFGMIKPLTINKKKYEKGKVLFDCCKCKESNVEIAWICKICKYLLRYEKNNDSVYCECGVYKKCDTEMECFKCMKPKDEATKTAECENKDYVVMEKAYDIPPEKAFNNQSINILFIGQRGAGKSMLANSIYNYLTYSFDELSKADTVNCILPCQFQLQTPDFLKVVFNVGPQDDNEHDNDNGQSVTQKPKIYQLKTQKYDCKVIDTPGLGDTRGTKQDEYNLGLIRNAVVDVQELHAICFVMPSNISKLTAKFETNIRDVLSLFPKTALKNVFFFFTYAHSTFFTIGDTRNLLEQFISTFKASNNAEIPFGMDNVCCVDSEAFMYFIATKQGHKYHFRDHESFRISWDKSKEATEKFLNKLENIVPIKNDEVMVAYELEYIGTMLLNESNNALYELVTYILMKISQITLTSKFNFVKKPSVELVNDLQDPGLFRALEMCRKHVTNLQLKMFIKCFVHKSETNQKNVEVPTLKEELKEPLNLNLNEFVSSPLISDNLSIYTFPKRNTDMDQNRDAIGIDLGTSRCCVAVNRKNGIETIPLDNTGERLLPSFVGYDEELPKCGQSVVDRLRFYSESTVFDSKRFIGKNIVNIDKMWPFKIVNIDNHPMIQLKTERGEIQQTATQVAGVLLKYMKQKAEEYQGKKLSQVIITVPAAFTSAQENATKEAAILAGWESVSLLPEPIAASFAYFIDRPIPNNSILLLFDLGGGTLDVCVFRIINNQIQIISENGDPKLGGRDFDNLLMDYFLNKLNMDYDISKVGSNMLNLAEAGKKLNLKDFRDKKFKLLMECQKIKISLSVNNEAILSAADIDPAKDENIIITQQNFRDLAEDLLNKIQNTILSALYKSGFKANQTDKVLLVGGGCRMPMVKNLLGNIFPSAEQCCEEHPDEVVAKGAAYYAYSIFSA